MTRQRQLRLAIPVFLAAVVLGVDVTTGQDTASTIYHVSLLLVIYVALLYGPALYRRIGRRGRGRRGGDTAPGSVSD